MPELPEVETTRRGIEPHLQGRQVVAVRVRERRLRWRVSAAMERELSGAMIRSVGRRAKYLLMKTDAGTLLLHLGMSGSLRIVDTAREAGKHDHVDLDLDSGRSLRFNDPRRFGCLLWTRGDAGNHPRLRGLGPEPLGADFDSAYLKGVASGRRIAIKPFLMNAAVVVGVGNIYASESLFRAGIHPKRAAGRVSLQRLDTLVGSIRSVLNEAIQSGGTTLRNFTGGDGRPGYFRHSLDVYGREGEPCSRCGASIRHIVLGQRATFYCSRCQR